MKYTLFLLVAVLFSGCAMETAESQTKKIESQIKKDEKPAVQAKMRQPVLVELFTSEG